MISAIAASFLYSGGLDGLEAMAIIIGFPFTLMILLMFVSIIKYFRMEV
nr:BCCT family transporter [Alkalihalobacillus pseudalcaliphilus]